MTETTERNSRKVRTGVVVSISGNKTIVVQTTERKRHPKYGKMMTTTKSERTTRVIDFDQEASMEQKKREGYF